MTKWDKLNVPLCHISEAAKYIMCCLSNNHQMVRNAAEHTIEEMVNITGKEFQEKFDFPW